MKIFNQETLKNYSLEKGKYILFTLHRQENTTIDGLKEILMALNIISEKIKVLISSTFKNQKGYCRTIKLKLPII